MNNFIWLLTVPTRHTERTSQHTRIPLTLSIRRGYGFLSPDLFVSVVVGTNEFREASTPYLLLNFNDTRFTNLHSALSVASQ
jgi:hypothetical protein